MTPLGITVLALSLSADAFAAALGRGAARRPGWREALRTGLVFGLVETVTPLLGWALGLAASAYVQAVDHWIAFVLLGLVGGRMVLRYFAADPAPANAGRDALALVAVAVGTSIDAAAVGVGMAMIQVDILLVAAAIGAATFVMATLGSMIGRAAGARLGAVVELLGGLALIALGTRILLQHTGVIG